MRADAAAIFKEFGATQVMECWGDDVPEGKLTSFPLAVQAQRGRDGGVFVGELAVKASATPGGRR